MLFAINTIPLFCIPSNIEPFLKSLHLGLLWVPLPKELDSVFVHRTFQSVELTADLTLYSARTENVHVKQDWLQVSHSTRHTQGTLMLSKIASSFALYLARRENAHVKWVALWKFSHTAAAWAACGQARLISRLALYSARSEKAYVIYDWSSLYSFQHAQKTQMLSKIDLESLAHYSARTESYMCQVRLNVSLAFFSYARKCIYKQDCSSLAPYSARTEKAHVKWDWP